MYYETTPIGYTNGLIIALLLLVVLWCLVKLEQRKEAKQREKMLDSIQEEMKKK
jgi:preprotein translocase subunit YajC